MGQLLKIGPNSRGHRRQIILVLERAVLRDKGVSGWQDFFNDIFAGFAGNHFVPRLYQPFISHFLDIFS